jgi:transcriptional antiterminator RfaH
MREVLIMLDETRLDPWHVLVVAGRALEDAAEIIGERGFATYLPRCRERRAKGYALVPMFPGYLFVRTGSPWWRPILTAPGVRERLRFGDVFAILTERQIEIVRAFEAESLELKVGTMVRVTEGPFADLEGPIGRFDRTDRIEILLRILGRQTTVRLPIRQVERVQPHACRA